MTNENEMVSESGIEIVKVVSATGWCWINKSDFDPAVHKLFGGDPAPEKKRKAKEE